MSLARLKLAPFPASTQKTRLPTGSNGALKKDTRMKTLIKRLFGITKLENELAGTWAELEATNLALITTRCQLAIVKAEREGLRESLVKMTQAKPGPWMLNKTKTKRYRKWEYPHSRSMWRTESEPIEQVVEIDMADYDLEEARRIYDEMILVLDPWDGGYPTGPRP